jgi:hypothetical protein
VIDTHHPYEEDQAKAEASTTSITGQGLQGCIEIGPALLIDSRDLP